MWKKEYNRQQRAFFTSASRSVNSLNTEILSLPETYTFHVSECGRKIEIYLEGKPVEPLSAEDRDNVHELKSWPDWFASATDPENPRNFEIRRNDREFQIGDYVILREFNPGRTGFPGGFTGPSCVKRITGFLDSHTFGVQEGFIVLGLEPVREKDGEYQ